MAEEEKKKTLSFGDFMAQQQGMTPEEEEEKKKRKKLSFQDFMSGQQAEEVDEEPARGRNLFSGFDARTPTTPPSQEYTITEEDRQYARSASKNIDQMIAKNEAALKEQIKNRPEQEYMPTPGAGSIPISSPEMDEYQQEIAPLRQQRRLLKETKNYYDAVAKSGDQDYAIERFWTGLQKNFDVANVVSLGIADMVDNMEMASIAQKAGEVGVENLTEDEKNALIVYNIHQEATEMSNKDRAYSVGNTIAETVPFIIDMVATRGAGAAVRKGTYKALTNAGMKNAFRKKLVSNLSDASARAYLFPMTYGGTAERAAPKFGIDEEMGLIKTEDGQDALEALARSGGETAVEIFSEGAIGAGLNKLMTRAAGKGIKMLDNVRVTNIFKSLEDATKNSAILKAASIQDPISEFGEEMFAGIVQPIVTGEGTPADFFEYENMIRTALVTSIMSFGMGSPSYASGVNRAVRINKGRKFFDSLPDEKKRAFTEAIQNDEVSKISKRLGSVYAGSLEELEGWNQRKARNQLRALVDYAAAIKTAQRQAIQRGGSTYQIGDKVYTDKEAFFKEVDKAVDAGRDIPFMEIRNDEATSTELTNKMNTSVEVEEEKSTETEKKKTIADEIVPETQTQVPEEEEVEITEEQKSSQKVEPTEEEGEQKKKEKEEEDAGEPTEELPKEETSPTIKDRNKFFGKEGKTVRDAINKHGKLIAEKVLGKNHNVAINYRIYLPLLTDSNQYDINFTEEELGKRRTQELMSDLQKIVDETHSQLQKGDIDSWATGIEQKPKETTPPTEEKPTPKPETKKKLPKKETSTEDESTKNVTEETKDARKTEEKTEESVPEEGTEGRTTKQGRVRDDGKDQTKEESEVEKEIEKPRNVERGKKISETIRKGKQKIGKQLQDTKEKLLSKFDRAATEVEFKPPGETAPKKYSVKRTMGGLKVYEVREGKRNKAVTDEAITKPVLAQYDKLRNQEAQRLENQELKAEEQKLTDKLYKDIFKKYLAPSKEQELVEVDQATELKRNLRSAAKAAREAKSYTVKEFKKVADSVKQRLKELNDLDKVIERKKATRSFFTKQQEDAIRNKLASAVNGSYRQQMEALLYLEDVIEQAETKAERDQLKKDINKIVNKERTSTKTGRKRGKSNRPIIDPETGEVTGYTKDGVSPEKQVYFSKMKPLLKLAENMTNLHKVRKKLQEGTTLTETDRKKLTSLTEKEKQLREQIIEAENTIANAEAKTQQWVDAKVRDAKMFLLAVTDIGNFNNLSNERLREVLGTVERREQVGAEKLNKAVEKSIQEYEKIRDIADAALMTGVLDKEQQKRASLHERRKAVYNNPKRVVQARNWAKAMAAKSADVLRNIRETMEKSSLHLESFLTLLDLTEDKRLKKYVMDLVGKSSSAEMAGVDLKSNQAFGKLLEMSGSKVYKRLQKKYGKRDDLIPWLIKEKKITPKDQARIKRAVGDILYHMSSGTVVVRPKGGGQMFLTFDEALKIYAWRKNPAIKTELEEQHGITDKVWGSIEKQLPTGLDKWADYIVDQFMVENYNEINAVHEQVYRTPLGRVMESYFPVQREKLKHKIDFEKESVEGNLSNHFYSWAVDRVYKTENKLILSSGKDQPPLGFVDLLNKYISTTEHFKAWAEPSKRLDALVNNPNFIDAMDHRGVSGLVRKMFNMVVNGQQKVQDDYTAGAFNSLMSRYASVQLSLKMNMVVKQITSFANGLGEADNAWQWLKHTSTLMIPVYGWIKARKLFKELYASSPKFKERVDTALQSDPDLRGGNYTFGKENTPRWNLLLRRVMRTWIPWGDQLGILYGYGGIYLSELEKTGSKEKAIQAFETYEGTQQARSNIYLTDAQMDRNAWKRAVLLFKSSPILYFNKTYQAIADMRRDFRRARAGGKGRIKSLTKIRKKHLRKLLVNHFISPMLFQMVAYAPYAMMGDWDTYTRKLRRGAIVGSLGGIFLVGDIFDWGVGKLFSKEKFGLQILRKPESIIDEPMRLMLEGVEDKELSAVANGMAMLVANMLGIPYETAANALQGIYEMGDGNLEVGIMRLMGWTEYTLKDAKKYGDLTDEEIMQKEFKESYEELSREAENSWRWDK